MNNLPLQPLVWHEQQGRFSTKSPITEYEIVSSGDKYKVYYTKRRDNYTREATGFVTVDDAKAWAWNHYNEKMQPYIKPSPTWVDASERLPEQNTEVLVRYHAHFDDEPITEFDVCVAFYDGSELDVKDRHFYKMRTIKVTHWMPIPEFKESNR